ncbi:MAG: hypothetical protein LBV51_02025 [Acholeplasmatales bacterium]|jgi:hypothetical protein|nr:hypothetical protein [Acholeplasmatales bacterium]
MENNNNKKYPWYKIWETTIRSNEFKRLLSLPGGNEIQLLWFYILDYTKNTNGILGETKGDMQVLFDEDFFHLIIPTLTNQTIRMGLDYYLNIKWLFKNKHGFLEIADKEFVGDQTTESYQRKLRRENASKELSYSVSKNQTLLAHDVCANRALIKIFPCANQTEIKTLSEKILKIENYENYLNILNILKDEPTIKTAQIREETKFSDRYIDKIISFLKEQGILKNIGNTRQNKWVIMISAQADIVRQENRYNNSDISLNNSIENTGEKIESDKMNLPKALQKKVVCENYELIKKEIFYDSFSYTDKTIVDEIVKVIYRCRYTKSLEKVRPELENLNHSIIQYALSKYYNSAKDNNSTKDNEKVLMGIVRNLKSDYSTYINEEVQNTSSSKKEE